MGVGDWNGTTKWGEGGKRVRDGIWEMTAKTKGHLRNFREN